MGSQIGGLKFWKVTKKVPEKATVNQQKIIKEMDKDPFITAKGLAEEVGISERKVRENIRKLKAKDVIQRVGSAKGGHWENHLI